ncbi:TetR/AcrR family transcriptional regulator [Cryptosporangium sp. NPDC051539]|uniref:TetR/AcrR family transcriptional regulator n=1 Tax=Cryptosporangium sp. NPDC051539 TaxID=3363962 RepID=UPI003798742E
MSSSPDATTADATAGGTARRPQAERSQETRLRILDAAVELLVEGGYTRTNTLAIQAKAGVSRGRLLHQFPSKEELLVAAAHHVWARQGEGGGRAPLPTEPAARIDAVVEGLWKSFNEPVFWAATELWVASRTEPALAEVIRPAERRLGREIWASLDALFGPELSAHPLYPVVRHTLFTSMRGVALAYAFDQRDPTTEPSLNSWKQLAKEILLTK